MPYAPTQPGIDTSGIGAANVQALTLFDSSPSEPPYPIEAVMSGPSSSGESPIGGNPVYIILGLLAGLVFLGWLRKQSSHLEGQTLAFNAFNFVVVILVTMIGFVLLKVVFSKYKVPGVTQLVHAA